MDDKDMEIDDVVKEMVVSVNDVDSMQDQQNIDKPGIQKLHSILKETISSSLNGKHDNVFLAIIEMAFSLKTFYNQNWCLQFS